MFDKTKSALLKLVAKGIEKSIYKDLAEKNPKALELLYDVLNERLIEINKVRNKN